MKIQITVEVDEGDPSADPGHEMGVTEAAYDRLTGVSEDFPPSLAWLGEVTDVEKV